MRRPPPALRATSPARGGGERRPSPPPCNGGAVARRRREPGPRALLAALALFALPLAGCGFTPLYATPGVSPALSSVEVVTPDGRLGHLLGEDLRDNLAIDRSAPPRYRLALAVDEQRYARGFSTEEVATWYELSVRVSYSLIDAGTGQTLTAGVTPVHVSYNAVNDPYAGIVAQQDGQKRAAAEAAQRIRIELASWFAGRAASAPGADAGP
jgi:LPS-assembly lipoprotein